MLVLPALLGGMTMAMAGCTATPENAPNSDDDAEATVSFRLWDNAVAAAYQEAVEASPDIEGVSDVNTKALTIKANRRGQ